MEAISILSTTVSAIAVFFGTWWWLILPLILFFPAKFLYKWWLFWEVWYKHEINWIMLEIIPPSEIEKPFKAMEDLFETVWPMWDGPNWREVWCEGEFDKSPFWFSFEIISIGGQVHFYMRIEKNWKNFVEGIIQTHYPDAEIFEVDDYTKKVPQNIPNENYDIYAEDYVLMYDYAFPIKTYKYFEPMHPEGIEGEMKIDPMHNLLETMAKLKKGEEFWFQIVPMPLNAEIPWVKHCKEMADKMARRPEKAKEKSIAGELAKLIFAGKTPFEEEAKKEEIIPPEMKLTPGERETLAGIEEKANLHGFDTFVRSVYIFEKGKKVPAHGKIARNYLSSHFARKNIILFSGRTRTKIHYFFKKRRLYLRKRNMLERYIKRLPSCYPKMTQVGGGFKKDLTMILNSEELASIFHFPTKASILPPGIPRVFAKKRGAPPGIPTE